MALTPEEIDIIQRLIDDTPRESASRLGIKAFTITSFRGVLRKAGVKVQTAIAMNGRHSRVDVESAISRLDKEPITAIAASFGVAPSSVLAAIATHNRRQAVAALKAAE